MSYRHKTIYRILLCVSVIVTIALTAGQFFAKAQYKDPGILPPPPPSNDTQWGVASLDSAGMPNLTPTIPPTYEALAKSTLAADLKTPDNVKTEVEYDPALGCYISWRIRNRHTVHAHSGTV